MEALHRGIGEKTHFSANINGATDCRTGEFRYRNVNVDENDEKGVENFRRRNIFRAVSKARQKIDETNDEKEDQL